MVRVLIDSSFLIAGVHFRMDIVREFEVLLRRNVELVMISPVEDELKSIASGRESRSREASQALEIVRMMPVESVARLPSELVDDTIVRIAKEKGLVIATNDRRLRKRLENASMPTIYLRQKTHLEAKGIVE